VKLAQCGRIGRDVDGKAPLVLGVLRGPIDAGAALQKALLSGASAEGRSNHSVRVKPDSSSHQSASERPKARVQPKKRDRGATIQV
jgi:hypothetical protein